MNMKWKNVCLLFYFLCSLFYMETLLRLLTTGGFFSSALLLSLLFSFTFAVIFYIICTLFSFKVRCTLTIVFISLTALLFSSQLVYYRVFKTFYSLYSAGNAEQIFEFYSVILTFILKNLFLIILTFLPLILFIVFRKKILSDEKIPFPHRALLIGLAVQFHLISVAALCLGSRDENSAFDLYFNSCYPNSSVETLGLITTMRLDLQRTLIGWSPSLEEQFAEQPVFSPTEPPKENPNLPSNPNTEPPGESGEEVVEYNTLNIDFDKLISEENNDVIKNMHKYFQSVQPTGKNSYSGKYKGYNLILITAESFSPYAVREDVTPTLYKLVHQGYYFTNFYNPIWGVSTSDGEYVACTSLIPKSGVWSFYKSGSIYMPFVMGNKLKSLGYKTTAYHDHTYTYYKRDVSHPNMGYEYKGLGNGLDVKKTWPESDIEMMEKTIPEYINNQPFHTYYMTVSGHMLYSFSGNSMAAKNKQYVENLPYSDSCKAYISCQIELDKAMEYLLEQLEEAGIADKTLIALSADHYPYGLEDSEIDELAGHTVEKNFELYKSNFILYTEGMEPVTIDKPCSSLDIIPTISNLLGLEYDSRLLMGRDIFSDAEPLVMFQNKSFITDKGRYNSLTKEFTPVDGASADEEYRKKISSLVDGKFYYSAKILDTDYYGKVLKK